MGDSPRSRVDNQDLFLVQEYEDKTNETVMVLESNADNMRSLLDFYLLLVEDEEFPAEERKSCAQNVKRFHSQLHELIYDVKMQVRRAKILVKTVSDRKAIVSHLWSLNDSSGLLRRFSSYNSSKLKLRFEQKACPQRCGARRKKRLRKPSPCELSLLLL